MAPDQLDFVLEWDRQYNRAALKLVVVALAGFIVASMGFCVSLITTVRKNSSGTINQ